MKLKRCDIQTLARVAVKKLLIVYCAALVLTQSQ